MKVIIAGSRTLSPDFDTITAAVEASGFAMTEVVCGCAAGVDTAGGQWAEERRIPVKHFPANWKKFGRRAGPLRNIEMVHYADAVLAFWDGESRGTAHTVREARQRGLKVYVVKISMAGEGQA